MGPWVCDRSASRPQVGEGLLDPVNIFKVKDGFVIALTYGSDVDWLKNVLADGGCTIRYRNKEIGLRAPISVSSADGMALMPVGVRAILRAARVTEFVKLHVA